MKIKIHNSILKECLKPRWGYFCLNQKIVIDYGKGRDLYIAFRPNSEFHFLCFNSVSRIFYEDEGFGVKDGENIDWWKGLDWRDLQK